MAYTFSTDQQSIIDSRNSNILVSAAAGSGKTSVLTERIVGLVNDKDHPADIDHILVVTFTNAAAREMKERIGKRLNELLAQNPGNAHLEKQATLIHNAQITTIDSFCLFLLKNHFTRIDLDPSFRVASENEVNLLKSDTLNEVIKNAYKEGSEEFFHVVDCFSKRDRDDALKGIIMELYNYACSYPFPLMWLENRKKDYDFESPEALEESFLISDVKDQAEKTLKEVCLDIEETIKLCLLPDGPYGYEESLNKDMEMVKELIETVENKSFDEIKAAFDNFSFATLKGKSDCDEEKKEYVKKLREAFKKKVTDLKTDFFFFGLSDNFEDLSGCRVLVNKVIELTQEFFNEFSKAKRDRDIIDFSDMEHMAVKILIDEYHEDGTYSITEVAKNYRDYFSEVMVDEYQDSNLVQELLISSVSREKGEGIRNRFMVGDVKQSIYRFRLARPEIFMGKLEGYREDEKAFDRLITLKTNYRSRASVIDSVNAVFETAMKKEVGGIEYDEAARLYKGGSFSEDTLDNRTKLILVKCGEKAKKARETQAEAISKEILSLVRDFYVTDKDTKELRKARFSDIALLFRAPSKWADTLKDSFEAYGIPYHLERSGAFYDATEIKEILSLLRVLDNPLDDISYYATMTSFFGKFSDEECAKIRAFKTGGDRFLSDAVRSFLEAHPEDSKVNEFVNMIDRYREKARILPVYELISLILNETGFKEVAAAMPDGEQRLANVQSLVMKACEYAKTSFYGLFHFLRYVELIKRLDGDEGEANTFDENANVVKVMSIHKSKGLEFPVCIIGGIDEAFNDKNLKSEFVTDIDLGIGASFIDPSSRIKRSTIKKNSIIYKAEIEGIGEEIRVLYVAMTRAKEKLIMVGLCDKPDLYLSYAVSASNKSYLSLIRPAVFKFKDKLFTIEKYCAEENEENHAKEEINRSVLRLSLEDNMFFDKELFSKVKEKFSFEYPYKELASLYTKTTVSNIKMAAIEKEDAESYHPFSENESTEYVPIFAGGEEVVKGTDRGTAYHDLLELIEFEKMPFEESKIKEELSRQIASLAETGQMDREDSNKVSFKKMVEFLKSSTAKEMIEASKEGKLYKEQPFVIGVPASLVEEDFPDSETILVQGVIDVFYIIDGKVTVLDYKTDRVESSEELIKRYRKQLEYYGAAVKQLTGLEVDKLLIYSFALNDTFVVK